MLQHAPVLRFTLPIDTYRVATWSGKSGNTKKNDKSQEKSGKNWAFEKGQEKKLKILDFASLILPNSLYLKAFKWLKLIKNSSKSDKNCKTFLEFY